MTSQASRFERRSTSWWGVTRPRGNYRPAIDGYRGLFVVLVMLYHFGVTALEGGWIGINHFFVFSGYLIAQLLIRERYKYGDIRVPRFYLRRMRRVVPAMAVLVTAVLVSLTVDTDGTRRQTAGDAASTLTFWLNWRLVSRNDQYFDMWDQPSPLRHAWTLAVEEQFYLFVPWLVIGLFLLTGRRMVRFWIVLAVAGLAAWWAAHLATQPDVTSSRLYYGTDVRMQALLVGMAGAFFFTSRDDRPAIRLPRTVTEILGWVGTVISLVAFFVLTGESAQIFSNGGMLFFAVAAAFMGVSATDRRDLFINRVFSWTPLVYLGQISYGLYLYHWPIDLWLPTDGWPLWLSILVKLALTTVLASISFKYLELPVMRDGFRSLVPRAWGGLRRWAGAGLVAALTAVAITMAGTLRDPATASYAGPPLDPSLTWSQPQQPLKVAMVGDSVPASVQDGFDPAKYPGLDLVKGARAEGCDFTPISIHVNGKTVHESPSCPAWREAWPQRVKETGADAVLATAGLRFLVPLEENGRELPQGSEGAKKVLRRNLDGMLAQTRRSGASQLLVINVPCRLLTPQQAGEGYRRLIGEAPRPIDTRWANEVIRAWGKQHAKDGVRVLDLDAQLCADGYRPAINGTKLYKDGAHFTEAGAALVWTWLAPSVARAMTDDS